MKVYLTVSMHFSAAHRLYNPGLSEEENIKIYGNCSNPSGHGHNYKLYVTVYGEPDANTGMVIDLQELKRIISEKVIMKVDHKNLNVDVDFLRGVNPTAENLIRKFWEVLKPELPDLLYELILYETDKQWVSYREA